MQCRPWPWLRRLNQVRRRHEDQSSLLGRGRQPIRHCPLPRAPISRISKVSVRHPSASVHRCSIERPMGCRRLAPNTTDSACSSVPPPSLPRSRCRYISLSPPSEESSNYSVGPNARTDDRTEKPASQTFGANERANPALYSLFPFLPSSPFSICSCRSLPRLATYRRTNERTNEKENDEVVGISKPQRASSL